MAGVGNINDADAPLRTEVEEAMELVDVCRCGPIVTKETEESADTIGK